MYSYNYGKQQSKTLRSQLIKCANPHSRVTSDPKIPDGSVPYSIGMTFRASYLIALNADREFTLYPGLLSCMGSRTINEAPFAQASNTGMEGVYKVLLRDGTTQIPSLISYIPRPEKWRMVSCGMRITPQSNAQQTSGNWEATRMSTPISATTDGTDNYRVRLLDEKVKGMPQNTAPLDDDADTAKVLRETLAFASGDMKNLSKYYFQLVDESVSGHEWKTMLNEYFLVNDDEGFAENGNTSLAKGGANNQENNETFIKDHVDNAFDTIIVRLQNGTGEQILKVDVSCNIEYIPRPLTIEHKFLTPTCSGYNRWKYQQRRLRYKNTRVTTHKK